MTWLPPPGRGESEAVVGDTRHRRLLDRIASGGWKGPLHERLCYAAIPILSVSTAALVLMSSEEAGALLVATDQGAADVEDLQFSLGEGPCLEAYTGGVAILEDDLLKLPSDRWPRFATRATAAGIHAVFALPLQVGGIRLGVLYLNRRETGMLNREQLADAFALADIATMTVLETKGGAPDRDLGLDSDGAWAHHAVVHQATGILSARHAIPIDQALALLRSTSVDEGRGIYEVARDVATGGDET